MIRFAAFLFFEMLQWIFCDFEILFSESLSCEGIFLLFRMKRPCHRPFYFQRKYLPGRTFNFSKVEIQIFENIEISYVFSYKSLLPWCSAPSYHHHRWSEKSKVKSFCSPDQTSWFLGFGLRARSQIWSEAEGVAVTMWSPCFETLIRWQRRELKDEAETGVSAERLQNWIFVRVKILREFFMKLLLLLL